jgi:hypothetical protein
MPPLADEDVATALLVAAFVEGPADVLELALLVAVEA